MPQHYLIVGDDGGDEPPVNLCALVLVRAHLRSAREYPSADALLRVLERQGCMVDDKRQSWTMSKRRLGVPRKPPLPPDAPRCDVCHAAFASRNLLFRHLRQGCDATLAAEAQTSSAEKKQRTLKGVKKAKQPEQQAPEAVLSKAPMETAIVAADRCLWFGELPAAWAIRKPLDALIYTMMPRGLPPGHVRKIVRRPRRGRPYAIVAFRDAAEADRTREAMDGLRVEATAVGIDESQHPNFVLRVRPCENASRPMLPSNSAGAGIDPPLAETLAPLSVPELWDRHDRLLQQSASPLGAPTPASAPGTEGRSPLKHVALAAVAAAYGARGGRHEVRLRGAPLPEGLEARLLSELRGLRWPARSHREHVNSERYLVLHPDAPPKPKPTASDDEYAPLRALCAELVARTCAAFAYSGIAVTKNFRGSPHIDTCDTSPQLATSLGDFEGGELCVDGGAHDGDALYVVETRGRLAQVDGRYVHWVRTFAGGDRYSLIFYDTTAKAPTPKGKAVLLLERGLEEEAELVA